MNVRPIKRWVIVARSARSEWICTWTMASSRRAAKRLWCAELSHIHNAEKLFKERIADGSLRFALVEVNEVADSGAADA